MPIISREIWEKTQALLKARSTHSGSGQSRRYLFSGKIRCGECGAVFVSRRKQLKNGNTLQRWSCATAVAKGAGACSVGKLLRDDDARHMIKNVLQSLQLDLGSIVHQVANIAADAIREGEGDTIASEAKLRGQIAELQRRKHVALDSFFAGFITKDEMQSAKEQYDTQIREITQQITNAAYLNQGTAEVTQVLQKLLDGRSESDSLYRSILDHITVYKDRRVELRLTGLPHIFICQ